MYHNNRSANVHVEGRTVIRLDGVAPSSAFGQQNATSVSQVRPLCCVPIQTTATLNIQLFPVAGGSGQRRQVTSTGISANLQTSSTDNSTSMSTDALNNFNTSSAEASTVTAAGAADAGIPGIVYSSHSTETAARVDRLGVDDTAGNCLSTGSFGSGGRSPTMATVSMTSAETMTSLQRIPSGITMTSSSTATDDGNDVTNRAVQASSRTADRYTSTTAINMPDKRAKQTTSSSSSSSYHISPLSSDRHVFSFSSSGVSTADQTVASSSTVSTRTSDESGFANTARVAGSEHGQHGTGTQYDEGIRVASGSRDQESSSATSSPADKDDCEDLEPSTFSFLGWDIMNELKPMKQRCRRVLVLKDPYVVLMFKAICVTDKAGNDRRLLGLMADVAKNCSKRLRVMRNVTLPQLSAEHLDSLPLSDGRKTGDHLSEISRELGEDVMIADVAYRFQSDDPDIYIGTFVDAPIFSSDQMSIGSAGVVVVLTKKNKYSTVEAFSEQLCQHIACTRPSGLGSFEGQGDRKLGRASVWRRRGDHQQLLLQSFTYDPTIIVAEAARRCFVSVDDFLLFK